MAYDTAPPRRELPACMYPAPTGELLGRRTTVPGGDMSRNGWHMGCVEQACEGALRAPTVRSGREPRLSPIRLAIS
eukprot:scaffold8471_cov91-Phaeocystis_antarctica.AAC.2